MKRGRKVQGKTKLDEGTRKMIIGRAGKKHPKKEDSQLEWKRGYHSK